MTLIRQASRDRENFRRAFPDLAPGVSPAELRNIESALCSCNMLSSGSVSHLGYQWPDVLMVRLGVFGVQTLTYDTGGVWVSGLIDGTFTATLTVTSIDTEGASLEVSGGSTTWTLYNPFKLIPLASNWFYLDWANTTIDREESGNPPCYTCVNTASQCAGRRIDDTITVTLSNCSTPATNESETAACDAWEAYIVNGLTLNLSSVSRQAFLDATGTSEGIVPATSCCWIGYTPTFVVEGATVRSTLGVWMYFEVNGDGVLAPVARFTNPESGGIFGLSLLVSSDTYQNIAYGSTTWSTNGVTALSIYHGSTKCDRAATVIFNHPLWD